MARPHYFTQVASHSTSHFFMAVFDLEERRHPKPNQRIPCHWQFSGEEPIVHLIGASRHPSSPDQANEAFDHIGFRMAGYDAFRAKLDDLQIPYSPMELRELNERRPFFIRQSFTCLRLLLEIEHTLYPAWETQIEI